MASAKRNLQTKGLGGKKTHSSSALDQRLNLTNTGNLSLNYGGQNEKWLLGNDGWYFVKPDGTLWKWDGTAHQATGTFQARSFSSRLAHHAWHGANSSNWRGAVLV